MFARPSTGLEKLGATADLRRWRTEWASAASLRRWRCLASRPPRPPLDELRFILKIALLLYGSCVLW
jgi:hypothetical protein